ncbi:hypothetical protein imdm_1742 [gamma proteobacterium IMCC2047]|nr:hypothetical protein imdm_1742 [gamma proteobacterium IMCC2047]
MRVLVFPDLLQPASEVVCVNSIATREVYIPVHVVKLQGV